MYFKKLYVFGFLILTVFCGKMTTQDWQWLHQLATIQVQGIDATSSVPVPQKNDLVFWQECLNTPQENCSLLYSADESHKVPMLISSSAVARPWLGLAGSRSAGPSSAFGFANSSAMVFLSFAVGQS